MTIEKLQDAFCEEAIEYMYKMNEEFYIKYFIELIPKKFLKNLRYAPDKKLKLSGKQNICIQNYLMDNFNIIMENTYKYLEIEPINNISEKFNWTEIINELIPNVNIFLNMKEKDILQELKNRRIIREKIDIQDISKLDDELGEEQDLFGYLDFNNRDKALIDIDGKILIGDTNQTHAQVLQDYLNTINDDSTLNDGWSRPGNNEINKLFNNEYSAFGHILDNNIFIETFSCNTSTDKILNDIKKSGIDYDKIYEYDCETIKRVARVIK